MNTLVDTCVWSLALRRNAPSDSRYVDALRNLIQARQAVMMGPIRQEILSGIRDEKQFERLQRHLSAFSDLSLDQHCFETAAQMSNLCRARGIQGSSTDFLICAAASLHNVPILTCDRDFKHYSKHLSIQLLIE